jgi:hypothetical protein
MNNTRNSKPPLPLSVIVNGEVQLQYDRGKPLSDSQLASLDRMDEQMDRGVRLEDEEIAQPDKLQRAQFVSLQLLEALQYSNDAMSAAGCAWLASRLPDLTQLKARLVNGGFSVELVFNEPYVREVSVDFTPRPQS